VTAFRSPSNGIADCIESCTACERLCTEAIAHCEARAGLATKDDLAVLSLCAEACRLVVNAIRAGTDYRVAAGRACAYICERSARICAPFDDDALMRACANACSNAARSCSELEHAIV